MNDGADEEYREKYVFTGCPECDGTGRIEASWALVKPGQGDCFALNLGPLPCRPCGGTGRLSPEVAGRIRAGVAARRARIDAGRSLLEEAKRLGMGVIAYYRFERGLPPEVNP